MNRTACRGLALVLALLGSAPVGAQSLVGTWEAMLDVGAMKLRLVLRFKEENGKLTGTLQSPDQAPPEFPLSNVSFRDGRAHFELPAVGAVFDCALDEGRLVGTLSQGGRIFPITFSRVDKPTERERPQNPVPPFPYLVEDVTFRRDDVDVTFAGTLTYPETGGPFPAVLLISGSGAQDRDETLFGHKPFWVLADYLTRLGLAVLRVDDRGVGGTTLGADSDLVTTEVLVQDALAAVAFLKDRPEIDPARIVLLGHSEGGLIAPLAAVAEPSLAGIVLLAAPGQVGELVILEQTQLLGQAAGVDPKTLADFRALQEKLFAVVKEETDAQVAGERIRDILADAAAVGLPAVPVGDDDIDSQIKTLLSPWFRFFLVHDPLPVLRQVRCPVLALNGEKDLQVASHNLAAVRDALLEGGNTDVTAEVLPGLNHLFQPCETGFTLEYAQIETTIAPTVLDMIGAWLVEHLGDAG